MSKSPRHRSIGLWPVILFAATLPMAGCSSEKNVSVKKQTQPVAPQDFRDHLAGFEAVPSNTDLYRKPLTSVAKTGTTDFTRVTNSGIEFTNIFPPDKADRLIETGAGVAIADYDGDGEVDVYLLATEGPNKLYRGLGGFKFEDVTEKAGVAGEVDGQDAWAAGASFADVDNDGDLDLFVCNMGSDDLLYINSGDGTFVDEGYQRGLGDIDASKIGSFCDYDLDGDLDLYVVTNKTKEDNRRPRTIKVEDTSYIDPAYRDSYGFVHGRIMESGQRDYLFRNDGKGSFKDVTGEALVVDHAMGFAASWLDYNDDGWPDLYVTNDTWQTDRLFLNNSDGTFTDTLPQMARHTPWFSKGIDSGDLNNDGQIDLMVTGMLGSKQLQRRLSQTKTKEPTWFLELGSPRQYARNAVYINSGQKFMETAYMTGLVSTDTAWAPRLVDLNNDGRLDVFVTNGNAHDALNADIVSKLKGLKGESEAQMKVKQNSPVLRQQNFAFVNRGELNFDDVSAEWGLDQVGISHGVATADFDHDGDLDMVINNLNEPVSVYRNESNEGNRVIVSLRSEHGNTFGFGSKVEIQLGDAWHTKHLTPVRGYLSSDQPIVHFGTGDATQVQRLRVTWPGGNSQEFENVETGFHYLLVDNGNEPADTERDADHQTAFVTESNAFDFVHFDGEHDDFARQPLLPYRASRLGPGVAIGDINDDGLPDVFIGNGNDKAGSLLVNRGGMLFENVRGPWVRHFLQDDMSALFFDANGDGFQDLLVTSGGSEYSTHHVQLRDRLYINRQAEIFEYSENSLPETAVSSSSAAAIDYDRDGDLDLVIGSRSVPHNYPNASASRLLRNDNGKFVEFGSEVAPALAEIGIVNSLLCSDFNHDGWTDLVIATEWGPVRFLENRQGQFHDVTASLGVEKQFGLWRGLTAGDFDSDGDLDYVVTNQGLNTKYQVDAEHGYRLYVGDFDGNGRDDLVETMFEGGKEYPLFDLSLCKEAMPKIGDKFESYEAFGKASVAEAFDLENTQHSIKEVNFLESAIFWNDGDSMRIEPLPRMAQTSPGFGVEALDYDCDGDIDILLANNFFSNQTQTGYMDGGLGVLLANNGAGNFEFVWPNRSGVVLENDSMGLAVADMDADGDPDSVVGVHSDKARLLVNQADPTGYKKLWIIGPEGNSSSVGAMVVATYENGKKQLHEVRAGGSYLSQSTSAIVLYPSAENPLTAVQVGWPTGEKVTLDASQLKELDDGGDIAIDVADFR